MIERRGQTLHERPVGGYRDSPTESSRLSGLVYRNNKFFHLRANCTCTILQYVVAFYYVS